jgi:hypothetical protein
MSRYSVRLNVIVDADEPPDPEFYRDLLRNLTEVHDVTVSEPHKHRISSGRPATERQLAERWLVHFMHAQGRDAPVPPGRVFDAAVQAGISRRTLRRAARSIGVIKDPPAGAATRWSLPKEVDPR